jgi:hypothetical protein
MLKSFSTIKTIEINGESHQFHDVRHAHTIEQAELMCNDDYSEKVVGEIVKIEPFDKHEKLEGH